MSELERRPSAAQLKVFARLRSLIAVCADGEQMFNGRSGPELGAAQLQMERFADQHPELSQSYFQRKPVKFKEDKNFLSAEGYPELQTAALQVPGCVSPEAGWERTMANGGVCDRPTLAA